MSYFLAQNSSTPTRVLHGDLGTGWIGLLNRPTTPHHGGWEGHVVVLTLEQAHHDGGVGMVIIGSRGGLLMNPLLERVQVHVDGPFRPVPSRRPCVQRLVETYAPAIWGRGRPATSHRVSPRWNVLVVGETARRSTNLIVETLVGRRGWRGILGCVPTHGGMKVGVDRVLGEFSGGGRRWAGAREAGP